MMDIMAEDNTSPTLPIQSVEDQEDRSKSSEEKSRGDLDKVTGNNFIDYQEPQLDWRKLDTV